MPFKNLTARLSQAPTLGLLLALALLTWIPYANTLEVPFVFDDLHNIKENSNVHLEDLSWDSLKGSISKNSTPRPLAYLSFALNHRVHGLEVRGYHLTNLLIHFINGCLVFFLSLRILTTLSHKESNPSTIRWIAFLAAALFLVHPIQIQAVTYLVQRMASLCALFQFGALLSYLQARETTHKRKRWLLFSLALLSWALALATKQNALILPLTLILCEWLLYQKGEWSWLKKAVPYALPIGILIFALLYLYKGERLFRTFEVGYSKRDFTMGERLLSQSRILLHYLSQIVWPHPNRFVLVYDFPISKSLFQPWSTFLSLLLITSSLLGAILARHRFPLLCFGLLWFFLNHIPESTLMPLELVYEHRNYLPAFGIFLILAQVLIHFSPHRSAPLLASLLVGLLTFSTLIRHRDWQSQYLLWKDNVAKQPTECRAHFNFAIQQAQQQDFAEAIQSFTTAYELNPNFQSALVRRGILLKEQGKLQEALTDFTTAIQIKPDKIYRDHLYGDAYLERGTILGEADYHEAALADLSRAIHLMPERSHCYFQSGKVYETTRQFHLALENYRNALELSPDIVETHNNIAWILATCPQPKFHDGQLAVFHALTACKLSRWSNYQTLDTLAAAYARSQDFTKALETQQKSLSLAPETEQLQLILRKELYQTQVPFQTQLND